MPKTYSDEEKKAIVEKLKAEANILMQEKGVKKTTVDSPFNSHLAASEEKAVERRLHCTIIKKRLCFWHSL